MSEYCIVGGAGGNGNTNSNSNTASSSSSSSTTINTTGSNQLNEAAKLVAIKRANEVIARKRILEDSQEPSSKKLAGLNSDYSGLGGGRPAVANMAPPAQMLNDIVDEHIKVPDNMVGLIIGRGGEQITRLQSESGCKIQMAADSGGQPDRVCTITGSREAVNRAKELVSAIVNERGRDNGPPDSGSSQRMGGGGGGGGGGNGGGGGGGNGGESQEEIMIPGPKVGLIIGKGGETIKKLQEKSGAKMVIIQVGPNPEFEKPLLISGDAQKVEHAKQLVYQLIAEKEMQHGGGNRGGGQGGKSQGGSQWGGGGGSGSGDEYDQPVPEGHEVVVPRIAVGVVIGKNGDMIKKIQAETGARVQFHQARDKVPGDRRCYVKGKPHQVEMAKQMIAHLIEEVHRRDQDGMGRSGQRGGSQRNGDNSNSYGSWGGPDKMEVSFTVSKATCGVIIGLGGDIIKQINAQSGAHCELDRRAQGNSDSRTFTIRGAPDSVEAAKRLISDKVGAPIDFIVESRGGGGGGGGGGGNGNGSNSGGNNMYGDYRGGYGGQGGSQSQGGNQSKGAGIPWNNYNNWMQNQMPQQPPEMQQSQQQQQQNIPMSSSAGQPDYSKEWIEYYRNVGLIADAEALEQRVKTMKSGGSSQPQSMATSVPPNGGGNVVQAAGAPQPDYSAQWAEYYRNIGLLDRAEAIENKIKQKSTGGSMGESTSPVSGMYNRGMPAATYSNQQTMQAYQNYAPYPTSYPTHPGMHSAPSDQ